MAGPKRSAAAIAAISVALATSTASAASLNDIRVSERVALEFWGGPTAEQCPAGVQLEMAPTASLDGPDAPGLNVAGRAQLGGCTYWLDEALLGSAYDYVRACGVVLHEWGHLNGHGHTASGVMRSSGEPAPSPCVKSDPILPLHIRWEHTFDRVFARETKCNRLDRFHEVAVRRFGRGSTRAYQVKRSRNRCRRGLKRLHDQLRDADMAIRAGASQVTASGTER